MVAVLSSEISVKGEGRSALTEYVALSGDVFSCRSLGWDVLWHQADKSRAAAPQYYPAPNLALLEQNDNLNFKTLNILANIFPLFDAKVECDYPCV